MATKKKAAASKKVGKVMHEFKHGELKSGGGGGKKVTNPKQAIAIGLSEARRSGADVPPPKRKSSAAKKKSGPKKTAARKTTAKNSGPAKKKAPAKKK